MNPLDEVYEIARHYVHDYAPEVGEECANQILGLIRARNLAQLCSLRERFPEALQSRVVYKHLMQLEAFFKKNSVFSDETICRSAAQKGFILNEKRCRIVNRRLDYYYAKRDRLDPDLDFKIRRMEEYVARVLGPISPFMEEIPRLVRFTSGASATAARKHSQPYRKVRKNPKVGSRCAKYASALSEYFGYGPTNNRITEWNRVEFVPKNWKTQRTIACEPMGNIPFQLAFDTYAKRRLRKVGIDLRNQSFNQELARLGSLDGSLATVDLEAASDTVAFNTVAWLFPQEWFKFLQDVRSPLWKGEDGTYHTYAKFSSMGNGSTFTIETLVFAAASYACGSRRFKVYGDDIVIEAELAEPLLRLLNFFGFRVNKDKSFSQGPFRESCGTNWYEGVDITPFYLRENPTRKTGLCHMVNGLASIALPGGRLWKYSLSIVKARGLRLVPFNADSTSGVWIDVGSAYSLKLITTRGYLTPCKKGALVGYKSDKPHRPRGDGIPKYKAYVAKTSVRCVADSRTLFLWHLQSMTGRGRVHREVHVNESIVTSGTPAYQRDLKYVSKRIRWLPPSEAVPDHLYWWSDEILREI